MFGDIPVGMKAVVFTIILSIFSATGMAQSYTSFAPKAYTPAQRNCRIAGGMPWVLNVGAVNDLELCIFGTAMIGSEALYNYTVLKMSPLAVSNYLNEDDASCDGLGGRELKMKDSDQAEYKICVFSDKSAIESNTLARGQKSSENAALTNALLNRSATP